MRVLLYGDVDLSLPGGLETHLKQLAHGLEARGHEVEIYGRPASLAGFRMVERIEAGRYDVLHHHGGVWPRGLATGARYVRTLHFCTAAKMANYLGIGRFQTLANPGNWRGVAEERRAARRDGRLIAVAPRVVRDFARFYGLDPGRAIVISNGATFSPAGETRQGVRGRFAIEGGVPVLLTVGRADYVKGHDLLGRVWASVRQRVPDAVWVAVGGERPHREPGRIVTGTLPHADVVNWIHAADVGAMPSLYEGCSVAMLEMLAGRLFVLAHDVGNADVVIRAGQNGALVPQAIDAWATALADALTRRPRGTGLDPEYHWDRIVERTEAVYREMGS